MYYLDSDIIQKNDMTFKVQKEKILLQYHKNNVVFASYNSSSHHAFTRFKKDISNPAKYNDISDVLGIAVKHEVRGVGGVSVTVHKTIAY